MTNSDWVSSSISEYQQGKKLLGKTYRSLSRENPDRKIIGGMIRDMDFAIQWLESGSMPGKIKGVDLKRVYQLRIAEKPRKEEGGYWDNSISAFVPSGSYTDPFEEADRRIDEEQERGSKWK